MKLAVLLMFLAVPLGASQYQYSQAQGQVRRVLASQPTSDFSSNLSIEERVLLLERDTLEQKNSSNELSNTLNQHMVSSLQTQTQQGEEIMRLEARLDLIYRFGALLGFVLTLTVPLLLWVLNRGKQNTEHVINVLGKLTADMVAVKVVLGIKSSHSHEIPEMSPIEVS